MTPALKAMVEAMAAELVRQARDDDGAQSFPAVGELRDGKMLSFDGAFDLEKVARAGLEAIREPDDATREAGAIRDDGGDITNAAGVFTAMIDAILTPTTGEKP